MHASMVDTHPLKILLEYSPLEWTDSTDLFRESTVCARICYCVPLEEYVAGVDLIYSIDPSDKAWHSCIPLVLESTLTKPRYIANNVSLSLVLSSSVCVIYFKINSLVMEGQFVVATSSCLKTHH